MTDISTFLEEKKLEYYTDQEIKLYTTIGIGGRAQTVAVVYEQEDLVSLLRFLDEKRAPFVLLGGGSNVVFPDGLSPLTLIVNRTARMEKLAEKGLVKINSGVTNQAFLSWAGDNDIGGMEFLAGLPGTIGGAAAVNAGAFGVAMDSVLEKADIFSPGSREIKTVGNDYFQFQYRNSIFKLGKEVILSVYLKYKHTPGEEVRETVRAKVKYRMDNHPPYSSATAGCFFKNPVIDHKKVSAGKLIEGSGFKGTVHNRLQVSHLHANFIINRDGCSFEDIAALEKEISQKVRENNGIQLEREVIYITPQGEKY